MIQQVSLTAHAIINFFLGGRIKYLHNHWAWFLTRGSFPLFHDLYVFPMHVTDGITGLSLDSFRDNWGSAYQTTNHAGVPDPNGKIYWDFK